MENKHVLFNIIKFSTVQKLAGCMNLKTSKIGRHDVP